MAVPSSPLATPSPTTAASRTPARRPAAHAFASTLQTFTTASGKAGQFYSLPALAELQWMGVRRLPGLAVAA